MAGQFSPTARPLRPGAYFNFAATTPQPVYVNTSGIVGLPFTHNWGPANSVVQMNSFADFTTLYGITSSPGYNAVRMCFQGEGLPGRGGAGAVLGYRMVGAGGLASSTILNNTVPAAAITLTAIYQGTFGNNVSVAVVANARNPTTQMDLQVYVSGSLTETWTFNKTDIASLNTLINDPARGSKWVRGSAVTTGTALAVVASPVALAGGNDGATLAGSDFTTMLGTYSTSRFGVFAPMDIASTATWSDSTGSSVLTAIQSWEANLNVTGKRFTTVIGGSAGDTATSAGARSAMFNDPNLINIGVGTFTDVNLGALTTSQLAPRLAGIVAARTEKQGLSFARLQGLSIVAGAVDSDILNSLSNGFMTISRDSNADAPVRFEKGLTTYSVYDGARQVWAYSVPKFVLTMQNIENELTEYAESNVIGRLPVDDVGVTTVLGALIARMKRREGDRIIQPGWTVIRNPNPAPTPSDDFISVLYGLTFIRDMEQILNTVIVS